MFGIAVITAVILINMVAYTVVYVSEVSRFPIGGPRHPHPIREIVALCYGILKPLKPVFYDDFVFGGAKVVLVESLLLGTSVLVVAAVRRWCYHQRTAAKE